jgi:hypothetical protein
MDLVNRRQSRFSSDSALQTKEMRRPKTFTQAIDRTTDNLFKLVSVESIDVYSHQDANLLRAHLIECRCGPEKG